MIQRIQATGKEDGCWKGICDKRTYQRFIAANKDWWPQAVDDAIKDFYNDKQFLSPNFTTLIIARLMQRVKDDRVSANELMKIDHYVRELRKDHIPG